MQFDVEQPPSGLAQYSGQGLRDQIHVLLSLIRCSVRLGVPVHKDIDNRKRQFNLTQTESCLVVLMFTSCSFVNVRTASICKHEKERSLVMVENFISTSAYG